MKETWTRRDALRGTAGLGVMALLGQSWAAFAEESATPGEAEILFLDIQPPGKMLRWQKLDSWITPIDDVFSVSHYGQPTFDAAQWSLKIGGLVEKPVTLTLKDLQARRRKEVTATLECSGDGASVTFMGAIGNTRWAGTPLAPLLRDCGIHHRAIETVFYGIDQKTEKIRDHDYTQSFARSLSMADALRDDVILAWEMNGGPLPAAHGGPVRLVVPGWFGIAWVKWLHRIELLDRRFMSRFMARDYVTIRGEEVDGQTMWRETSVGPIDVKSMVARATRKKDGTVVLMGAAWTDGTPLEKVEVRVDDGAWEPAELVKHPRARYAWTFWRHEWRNPAAGDHKVVSRAVDREGRIQPSEEDPAIKLKRTYWESNQQRVRRIRI